MIANQTTNVVQADVIRILSEANETLVAENRQFKQANRELRASNEQLAEANQKLREDSEELAWHVGQLKQTMGEIELDCAIAKSVIEQAESDPREDVLAVLLELAKARIFAAYLKSRNTEIEIPF